VPESLLSPATRSAWYPRIWHRALSNYPHAVADGASCDHGRHDGGSLLQLFVTSGVAPSARHFHMSSSTTRHDRLIKHYGAIVGVLGGLSDRYGRFQHDRLRAARHSLLVFISATDAPNKEIPAD